VKQSTIVGSLVDTNVKKQLTDKALCIRTSIFKYMDSHLSTDHDYSKTGPDEKLKEKGLLHTMRVSKFARFWDVSRATQLQPNFVSLLPYANLIHSVSTDKILSLSAEVTKYLELAKDIVVVEKDKSKLNCDFFEKNKSELTNFYDVFRLIALIQPSNASSERVLSVYASLNFDRSCLLETIQSGTIMRYNWRK